MSATGKADESEFPVGGAPPRHVDPVTARLDMLAREWIDSQKRARQRWQRGVDDCARCDYAHEHPGDRLPAKAKLPHGKRCLVAALEAITDATGAHLTRMLRSHVLWEPYAPTGWPGLRNLPGLGGAHVALVIGRIGDPRRFPGQRCTEGHYLPPLYAAGSPCPIAVGVDATEEEDGDGAEFAGTDEQMGEDERRRVCPGVMLPPRTTTGVRSIWHLAGLHAIDGRSPRKTKGQRCDWDPRMRTSFLQPGGICEQIVRLGTRDGAALHKFGAAYLVVKPRLTLRVPEVLDESDLLVGDAIHLGAADEGAESERGNGRPLRPYQADAIAKKVAGKQFLGDLLVTWKHILDSGPASGAPVLAPSGRPMPQAEATA